MVKDCPGGWLQFTLLSMKYEEFKVAIFWPTQTTVTLKKKMLVIWILNSIV